MAHLNRIIFLIVCNDNSFRFAVILQPSDAANYEIMRHLNYLIPCINKKFRQYQNHLFLKSNY